MMRRSSIIRWREITLSDRVELEPGNNCLSLNVRRKIQKFVDNLCVQLFISFLVFLDTCNIIIQLFYLDSKKDNLNPNEQKLAHVLNIFSITILTIFGIEVFLRLLFKSCRPFFTDAWCVFDFIVVSICIVFEVFKGFNFFIVLRIIRGARGISNVRRIEQRLGHVKRHAKDSKADNSEKVQLEDIESRSNLREKILQEGDLVPGIICLSIPARKKIQKLVDNVITQFFIAILVIIDAIFYVIYALVTIVRHSTTDVIISYLQLVILAIFGVEVFLRLLYMDFKPFFSDPWCVFDFTVVLLCIVFELLRDVFVLDEKFNFLLLLRMARALRVLANYRRVEHRMEYGIKGAVSGQRRRYKQDGFDIDATYITERLLAMSVPAMGTESIYRNPISEVVRFFETKHTGHYRLYNCVPERKYPYKKFNHQVCEFFMEDHNPTPIGEIIKFCHNVDSYFNESPLNVASVHCKGGKGRTGTMICSYLIFSGYKTPTGTVTTAKESMSWFAARRTVRDDDKEGVEARSQVRYIQYMERLMKEFSTSGKPRSELVEPNGPNRAIIKLRVIGIKYIMKNFGPLSFKISKGLHGVQYEGTKEDCQPNPELQSSQEFDFLEFRPKTPIVVHDDVKVDFYTNESKEPLFGYWWHTYFEEGEEVKENSDKSVESHRVISFTYPFVDGIRWAIKEKKYKNAFPKYFECQTFFK